MSLRLLYLIFVRLCGWLVLLGRSPASAKAYMRQYGFVYPSLSDPGDLIAAEFNRLIPISALPCTLVISPDGRIAGRVIGAVSV